MRRFRSLLESFNSQKRSFGKKSYVKAVWEIWKISILGVEIYSS